MVLQQEVVVPLGAGDHTHEFPISHTVRTFSAPELKLQQMKMKCCSLIAGIGWGQAGHSLP